MSQAKVNVSPGKKSISACKVEANRRNARLSTGPRTSRGKRYSRRNAFKHGLTANSVIFDIACTGEDPRQYVDLWQRLRDYYQPVGVAEELEIEKITRCWWKLRRVSHYEDAEIRFASLKAFPKNPPTLRIPQLRELISVLRESHEQVRASGEIPEKLKENLDTDGLLRAQWPKLQQEAKQRLDSLTDLDVETVARGVNKGRNSAPESVGLPAVSARQVKDLLQEPAVRFQLLALVTISLAVEYLVKLEADTVEYLNGISLQRQAMPSDEAMEKVLRYEAAAERQLSCSIERLERLQRTRKGESLPAALNVNLRRTS